MRDVVKVKLSLWEVLIKKQFDMINTIMKRQESIIACRLCVNVR